MLISQLFTKTTKDAASDASSRNADLLTRGGYIHKTMAGVYSYLPLGLKVLRKVENIVREEMDAMRMRIGFLFQSNALYDSMTVRENLEFPMRRHSVELTAKEAEVTSSVYPSGADFAT